MSKKSHFVAILAVFSLANLSLLQAQTVKTIEQHIGGKTVLGLSNDQVEYTVILDSNMIVSDKLLAQPSWMKEYGSRARALETDADFGMEIMWTDWQAPGKVNNAENPVKFSKNNFVLDRHAFRELEGGKQELELTFHGKDIPLFLRLTVQLEQKSFYLRRKLALSDTSDAGHFLQKVMPINAQVSGVSLIVKDGGFGQPIALQLGGHGGFFGVEYPAADNLLQKDGDNAYVSCGHEMGEKIGKSWLESEWAVEAITPNTFIKQWFMQYVDNIRVAPLRPYTLYNSWYDLRSPEYPRVPAGNIMNEENIFRIIGLIDKNMIEKHNIKLDAFVLDDGWDVYESDWVMRKKQFPRGLKPIAEELKKTNTSLGMWFGPTGGYSYRMRRIDWMKNHGYEVVGHTRNTAMMCLGGTKYGKLFKERTTDFVAKEGVAFFKWDGIQFSCSEPDHGHATGIYSRRAVMESLIDKCRAVREKNPNVFLNITSGTWLSPWWVKYANQIWMQGADYGYADVPSISPRDAAITYRDFVLYDDFTNQKMWFPIANLMTHGIIKGNLEMLGGKEEPLDKFTNEALLYFARGVSMWELYISPDILTEGEWDAMGQAMHWARDRFPILSTTEMIGGDPTKGQTYGYTHFKGKRGIIAARNPLIDAGSLSVTLSQEQGLDPTASSLVVEKVYPNRWISPTLYKTGSTLDIALDGYETAIYEVYPVSDAKEPLLAGVPFETVKRGENYTITVYDKSHYARLLNPDKLKGTTDVHSIIGGSGEQPEPLDKNLLTFKVIPSGIRAELTLHETVREGLLSILLTPGNESASRKLPQVRVTMDGKEDTAKFESGESVSTWYTVKVSPGKHTTSIDVVSREKEKPWRGHASVWMICQQQQKGVELTFQTKENLQERPMPPRPFPKGIVTKDIKLGEAELVSVERK